MNCPSSFESDTHTFEFSGGSIPDAAAIHAARKQREAMREGRGKTGHKNGGGRKKDYIPLSGGGGGGGEGGRSKGGRLARGSDESGSDEDKIDFAGVRSDRQVNNFRTSAIKNLQ